ncbi:GNAT family N-acetyltransferase [Acidovorax sp. SUPP2539]|uniref:GNAT family N-acetyltransferase n=1 Tax=Acidovorax sp. SUPP2539 TaxID=2920878 RepID=UPI0023DE5521|nr:GNAT family N-acetyltransferase [Acidovorax sp. SUPP2539]GKS92231.1 GNAT family N-acetyltransferase [Acidovorax sp. SUPP2539]
MRIRRIRTGDESALRHIYFSAIHGIASRDYTPDQIDAWAPQDFDAELWAEKVRKINPFLVEDGDRIVGYADVQPSGYIHHFFVSGAHPRRGIGTMLMDRIHEEARKLCLTELTADVSRTAEPFFVRYGFCVIERRFPVRSGVTIPNSLMKKELKHAG